MASTHTPGKHLDDAQKQIIITTHETLGGTVSTTARATGHTWDTVARVLHDAGHNPDRQRTVTQSDVAGWIRRYQAGDPVSKVAVDTGDWSDSTVRQHLIDAGIQMRPQGWAGRHAAEAIRAAREAGQC